MSVFDFAGNFLARVASGGVLNAPWGTALADPNFGAYGGDLLIGNFGDGRINAFHENADGTWTPSGTLRGLNGQPLFIGGLWAIQFGSGAANNGQRNHLYFTAGPNGETAGLFGRIIPNPSEAGGTVPATLSLSLGAPANFGAFTPGVGREYTASTSANVISSAGDATLTVADPSATNTGKLVNGAFTLTAPLSASATSAVATAAAGGSVGGSGAPTTLLTYAGPSSNDAVTITFKQSIGVNEALRTRHLREDAHLHALDDDPVALFERQVVVDKPSSPVRERRTPPAAAGSGPFSSRRDALIRVQSGMASVGAGCRGFKQRALREGEWFVGWIAVRSGGRGDRAASPREQVQRDRQGTGHGDRGRSCVNPGRFWPFSNTVARSSWRVRGGVSADPGIAEVSGHTPTCTALSRAQNDHG